MKLRWEIKQCETDEIKVKRRGNTGEARKGN